MSRKRFLLYFTGMPFESYCGYRHFPLRQTKLGVAYKKVTCKKEGLPSRKSSSNANSETRRAWLKGARNRAA